MKRFPLKRTRNGAVRTDHPEVKAEHLGNRKSKSVPASGDQHNFNVAFVRSPKSREISIRDLELGVKQGPVDINREQADRKLHHE